jgi:hypothetical protein
LNGVLNARVYTNPNIGVSPAYQDFSFNFFAKQIILNPVEYSNENKYVDNPDQFITKYLKGIRSNFFSQAISWPDHSSMSKPLFSSPIAYNDFMDSLIYKTFTYNPDSIRGTFTINLIVKSRIFSATDDSHVPFLSE